MDWNATEPMIDLGRLYGPNRMEAMVAMRDNGMTQRAIGEVFGITAGRVWNILRKAERIQRWRAARKGIA